MFATHKLKLRMRRKSWRPYTVGLVNYDYIKDETIQRKEMKIAIEYIDYEKTFGFGLERSVEEDDMHKFHFIINLWRFVFFIRFIKWHSEEEYWRLRRKEGYMKEIGWYLWCDDEGWHFVFNSWFWDIPLDRQGRNFKSIIKDRILQRRK